MWELNDSNIIETTPDIIAMLPSAIQIAVASLLSSDYLLTAHKCAVIFYYPNRASY